MKHGQYTSACVVCPAYRYETRNEICCRGPKRNASFHTAFGNAAEKLAYRNAHCRSASEGERCAIYGIVKDLPEVEEDEPAGV